jgi:hypothetical protein
VEFKLFGRSPTLWVAVITSAVLLLGTFGFGWLTGQQAGLVNAAILAAGGLVTALLVRPFQPAAFTGLLNAMVALVAAYGLNLSPETVTALNTFGLGIFTLLLYGNVSPIETPLTKASNNPTPEAAKHAAAARAAAGG